jgi:hypothetical protein
MKSYFLLITASVVFIFSSCDKGYELRFTNLYIDRMDSVVVGNNKIVHTDVSRDSTTGYKKIQKGKHAIRCVSRNGKKFYSSIFIPSRGSGKRTIQIDAVEQISIFEE